LQFSDNRIVIKGQQLQDQLNRQLEIFRRIIAELEVDIAYGVRSDPFTFWMALKRHSFLSESATLQRSKSAECAKCKWTGETTIDTLDVLLKITPEGQFPRADEPREFEKRISVLVSRCLDVRYIVIPKIRF